MSDPINIRNYFDLPLKEAWAIFKKVVPDPRPLEPGEMVCPACKGGDHVCGLCNSTGRVPEELYWSYAVKAGG